MLCRMEYSRDEIKAGLNLLLECPWATAVAEQQHGSMAVFRKFHQEYEQESMMSRSFPTMTPTNRHIEKEAMHLRRLLKKKPQRISGCHVSSMI